MDQVSSHAQAHLAFSTILSTYQERAHEGGLTPLNPFADNQTPGGTRPSISDFLADVELSAGKCLTPAEAAFFNNHYKSLNLIVDPACHSEPDPALVRMLDRLPVAWQKEAAELDSSLRSKLGSYFIQAGIFPLSTYLRPS